MVDVGSMPRSRDGTLRHYLEQKEKDCGPPTGERHFCKCSRFLEAVCWLHLVKFGSFQKEAVWVMLKEPSPRPLLGPASASAPWRVGRSCVRTVKHQTKPQRAYKLLGISMIPLNYNFTVEGELHWGNIWIMLSIVNHVKENALKAFG